MEIIILFLIILVIGGIYTGSKYIFSSSYREEVKLSKIKHKERHQAYIDKQYQEARKPAPNGCKLCPDCSVRGVTRKEYERITHTARDHVKCDTCDDLYYVSISDAAQTVGKIERMIEQAKKSLLNEKPSFEELIKELIFLYGREKIKELFARIEGLYLLTINTKHVFCQKDFEEYALEHKLNSIKEKPSPKRENNAIEGAKTTGAILIGVAIYVGLIFILVSVILFFDNLSRGVKIAIGIPAGIAILIYTILYITGQVSGFPGSSADKYHN